MSPSRATGEQTGPLLTTSPHADGSDWVISHDPRRTEVIASRSSRTLLLHGKVATAVLEGGSPSEFVTGESRRGPSIAWTTDPKVATDTFVSSPHVLYRASADLLEIFGTPTDHLYVLATREVTALVQALEAGKHHAPVTPVLLYGDLLLVGPTLRDTAPCSRCWSNRILAGLPSLRARVLRGHSMSAGCRRADDVLATARMLWERSTPSTPLDRALVLDLNSGEYEHQRVIPLSSCSCVGATTDVIDTLVGRPFGIVHAIGSPEGIISGFTASTTMEHRDHPVGVGSAVALDPTRTARRSISEAVERRAAREPAVKLVCSPASELSDAIPAATFSPYTDTQCALAGFPFPPVTEQTPLDWVRARRLLTGQAVFIPVDLVTLVRSRSLPRPFVRSSSTGIAAATSWAKAVENAVLELVERDQVVRAWVEASFCSLDLDEFASAEASCLQAERFSVRAARCPEAPAPIVVAEVVRHEDGHAALGAAASASLADAARHAVEEAVLMFAHRQARGVPVAESLAARISSRDPHSLVQSIDWTAVLDTYDPIVVDLTSREAQAVGLRVASAWSQHALDFPTDGDPLPLRRWPGGAEQTDETLSQGFPFTVANS